VTRAPSRLVWPAVVVAATMIGSLAGCGIQVKDRPPPSSTTSASPPDREGPSSTTSTPSTTVAKGTGVDPAERDVPDQVFAGQGDPRIDVRSYAVTLTADPGSPRISGRVTMTLAAATTEPLRSFTLDLHGPKVSAAQVAGRPARINAGPDQIEVVPAAPLAPGRAVDAVFTYAGTPRTTTFPRLGSDVGWQQDKDGGWFTMSEPNGTASWVPVSDHPSDKARWSITLDTPADATGVANGRLVSSTTAKGRRAWVWRSLAPMAPYLAFVAVGHYDLVQRDGPDGIHLTFAFPPKLPAAQRAGFDHLDDILSFYGKTFGPYPFADSGATVVTTSLGLALESQTRPLFGEDAIGDGVVWALPHEVAHQWFGDAVSPARWQDVWLNESFATYADWLYTAHTTGRPMSEVMQDEPVPTVGNLAVTDPKAASTFDGVVYEGGARALHALRLEVGDKVFFQILRTWFSENSGRSVTTEDFTDLAERVSKRDLDAFFDAWLRSPKQPELPH